METKQTMPANQPAQKTHSAKTLFLYFIIFFLLGVVAFATGALWFQFINKFFPLEVSYGGVYNAYSQYAVKNALAALIIGGPLFLVFSRTIRKSINQGSIMLGSGPRQWVTYIILFIVAAISIGDGIAVVMSLLNGDFTARFLLKALTILIITGSIFGFFWTEIKSDDGLKTSRLPFQAMIATAIVLLISVFAGLTIIDSPATARKKAYDSTREQDLSTIMYQVQDYYARKQQLPATLADLDIMTQAFKDPQTGVPYVYEKVSDTNFKLCADFATSNLDGASSDTTYRYDIQYWKHDAKNTCFDLSVELDNNGYPLPLKPVPMYIDNSQNVVL